MKVNKWDPCDVPTYTRRLSATDLVFKPYQIALTPARKPHRTLLLITHKNGDFGAISVTERSLAIWFNHSLSRAST